MVRTWVMVLILLVFTGMTQAVVDFNDLHLSVWPMATDSAGEVRIGVEYGVFEAYVAPRYDNDQLDTSNNFMTTIRAYGFYNAFDANMAAYLLDISVKIPDGQIYAGLFGGYAIDGGTMEFGWVVGGRVELYDAKNLRVDGCVEYEQNLSKISTSGSNGYAISGGPRFRF